MCVGCWFVLVIEKSEQKRPRRRPSEASRTLGFHARRRCRHYRSASRASPLSALPMADAARAEERKRVGNEMFAKNKLAAAIEAYSEAICFAPHEPT